jgi:excisionase family DNA binding protein
VNEKSVLEDPFLGVSKVAKIFDTAQDTIRQWIYDGKIKAQKINGQWKIRESEVNRLAQEEYGRD